MKRVGFLMQDIACYQNVAAAYVLARRGKRQRPEVRVYESDLTRNLNQLVRDLLDEAWTPSGYRCFVVRDPKHRLIHAAPFADRVAHHALMRIAGPILERGAIDHSYACRKGKGSHAAIRQAHRMLLRHGMALHLDIRKYFDSISHTIIHELLWRKIKDVPFLCTLDRILLSYETVPGRGLPIGSLTSQYLANMFLDGLDHWLCAHADCRAHVRYMDDLVLFHPDATALRRIRGEIVEWLHEHRELELKQLPEPVSAADGFHFLGTRITDRGVFLARPGRKRWARHMHDLHVGILNGSISENQAQRKSDALFGSIQHTRSGAWRRNILESLPEVDL